MALQLLAPTLPLQASIAPAQTKPSNGRHHHSPIGRRVATAAVVAAQLLAARGAAAAFDFRMTAPEQTEAEAEAAVRAHARELVRVKEFIDARSWRETQAALRASAPILKQDLYTIIKAMPAGLRPELRRLYSTLFNNVTTLEYAARDKDESQVQQCYNNILAALDEIFARIS